MHQVLACLLIIEIVNIVTTLNLAKKNCPSHLRETRTDLQRQRRCLFANQKRLIDLFCAIKFSVESRKCVILLRIKKNKKKTNPKMRNRVMKRDNLNCATLTSVSNGLRAKIRFLWTHKRMGVCVCVLCKRKSKILCLHFPSTNIVFFK